MPGEILKSKQYIVLGDNDKGSPLKITLFKTKPSFWRSAKDPFNIEVQFEGKSYAKYCPQSNIENLYEQVCAFWYLKTIEDKLYFETVPDKTFLIERSDFYGGMYITITNFSFDPNTDRIRYYICFGRSLAYFAKKLNQVGFHFSEDEIANHICWEVTNNEIYLCEYKSDNKEYEPLGNFTSLKRLYKYPNPKDFINVSVYSMTQLLYELNTVLCSFPR